MSGVPADEDDETADDGDPSDVSVADGTDRSDALVSDVGAPSDVLVADGGDAERERPEHERPGGIDRRTLIRILVGLGIGIPVLIEALTLLGLVGDLFGPGDGETPTPTETATGVGVGDELLPETPATDTVESAFIALEGWTFTMVVGIENTTDRTYELRLRSVTTDGGATVRGGGESDPVPPGESGSVTGSWDLPEGSSPASVDVVSIARDGTVTKVDRTVTLGSVPVRGG